MDQRQDMLEAQVEELLAAPATELSQAYHAKVGQAFAIAVNGCWLHRLLVLRHRCAAAWTVRPTSRSDLPDQTGARASLPAASLRGAMPSSVSGLWCEHAPHGRAMQTHPEPCSQPRHAATTCRWQSSMHPAARRLWCAATASGSWVGVGSWRAACGDAVKHASTSRLRQVLGSLQ